MRRDARIDANQPEIVKFLRKCGATVKSVAQIKGFCDLVVGYRGVNELVEVKDGTKPSSKQELTPDEQEFHDTWRGSVHIVRDLDDAQALVNLMAKKAEGFKWITTQ